MRQLVYTMFISNNRVSFHLWWKESLVKHQKVSKYYAIHCRSELEILHQCGKGLNLKVRKFLELISSLLEVTREKLVVGILALPTPIMIRVKQHSRNNSLKELQNYKRKLFLRPSQKIGESTTNILKLLLFTINLPFFYSLW